MPIVDAVLAEWDQEVEGTRRLLERVPADQLDWRPHEKSYTLRQLAGHLAQMHGWVGMTLNGSEFDINPTDGGEYPAPSIESAEDLLAIFDKATAEAREVLAATEDGTFAEMWALKNAGEVIFEAPKAGVLRRFVMNHLIHHRGQLTVYMRMLDVPLPNIYGPTADEPDF